MEEKYKTRRELEQEKRIAHKDLKILAVILVVLVALAAFTTWYVDFR